MINKFESSFANVLIYIFRVNDEAHRGCLKIGKATVSAPDSQTAQLETPNSRLLNQAAKARIDQYMTTCGMAYELLHAELAKRRTAKNPMVWEYFTDSTVHSILKNSGIKKQPLGKSREWFKVDLQTAIRAIAAAKQNRNSLTPGEITQNHTDIEFRPEQEEAIKMTIKRFKTDNKVLWNAKMRFGKTLCALEVVKQEQFKKTIIMTHRPVVDNGWHDDFNKIFWNDTSYHYCEKGTPSAVISQHCKRNEPFIYFASIQDLRGSDTVGGKFDKNSFVFSTNWDCVIVDEAHEGTQTSLGDEVLKEVIKAERYGKTKQIYLSGTPFNLVEDFENGEVYTWDYVMEQRAKRDWNLTHELDSNPYESLPELQIYTYDLGKEIKGYIETEDKAFNFKEFFRTWTGLLKIDKSVMPLDAKIGDFVHENDVRSFINLLVKDSNNSNYPFSNETYRNYFRHTLWMLPGVREARAFSKLLQEHPVFKYFSIANVAGDGDEEDASKEALEKVQKAITDHPENTYSITLSCGRLTTGVSVKPWTAVMMLAGSYSTSASSYLQTIFRVQTPANINGMVKDKCFVFDFAPDRTLKMVAEAGKLSTRPGSGGSESQMGEFLNFCPVISVNGSEMKAYNVDEMLQQIKRVYAEKVAQSGFDDVKLYNDELLKLDSLAIKEFENLKKIVGTTKANAVKDVVINDLGLTNEEKEQIEKIKKKPKKELTEEEKRLLEERKKALQERNKAISILRSISIRIPLLIYGAQKDFEEDITIDNFADMIDEESWNEFMPAGVTKNIFASFIKYYDKDIFIGAGKSIRRKVKAADELNPTERVKYLAGIFATFKNPDKETVLTPWRVVNMHMSDTLGGWDFFDEEHKTELDSPRKVSYDGITKSVFSQKSRILEINSKTGLYPLFATYSIYRERLSLFSEELWSMELQEDLWEKTLKENIFVVCKTEMAKFITRRTLLGYKEGKINSHYFDDLINQFRNKPEQVVHKINSSKYWKAGGDNEMKFDAIIGNPPYQINIGSGGKGSGTAVPIYNLFIEQSKKLKPKYLSLIVPSRWFSSGRGLDDFRKNMLNDSKITKIVDYADSRDCFPSVDIAGGVNYFLWNNNQEKKDFMCEIKSIVNGSCSVLSRPLNEFPIFIRDNRAVDIIRKVQNHHEKTMDKTVSPVSLYGLNTNFNATQKGDITVKIVGGYGHCLLSDIRDGKETINKYKVFISASSYDHAGQADNNGQRRIISAFGILPPNVICTSTYIVVQAFNTEKEAKNMISYLRTLFVRFLLSQVCISQHLNRECFLFVPLPDCSREWTDYELFEKYDISEDEIAFIKKTIKPMPMEG